MAATSGNTGPLTAEAFAAEVGIAPRYAAEWLEQQATAGLVSVVESGDRGHRRYGLDEMGDPSAALSACRALVADDGVVLVADMAGSPEFTAPGDESQRFLFAFSVLHCLPVAMADAPTPEESAALGTVLRPAVLEQLAAGAGFGVVTELDISHEKWRFWTLQS